MRGKVAIITGASGGLGKEIALRFAREGAKLAICARSVDKLEQVAKLCEQEGAKVFFQSVDLTETDAIKKFVAETINSFETIDILVNNGVSITSPHPFMEHTLEQLDMTMKSGLYGTWTLMQECFPYLKDKNSSIINFGSGAGREGLEGYAAYAATKEAIRGLTRVAAREWGKYGIRVNVICPSAVTDTVKESLNKMPQERKQYVNATLTNNALHRAGDPYEDITPVVVFLASEESKWITGQNINAEGGGDIHC